MVLANSAFTTFVSGAALGAEINFPTAAGMIDSADVIAVGQIRRGPEPRFDVKKSLKGGVVDGQSYRLSNPFEGMTFGFSLDDLGKLAGGSESLFLGGFDASAGVLKLDWVHGSIWPHGYRHQTFPSQTTEQSISFVRRVLAFSEIAGNVDALIRELLRDIAGPFPHAALAYLEIAVERDFSGNLPELPFILRALAAHRLSERPLDAAAQQQLALIAPSLPPSLGIPLLIRQARVAGDREAFLLRNVAVSALRARRAEVTPTASSEELLDAYATLKPQLAKVDGRRLLTAFDLDVPFLEQRLADEILEAVLGRTLPESATDSSPQARRAAWAAEIDKG